ncbi:hypothetical protein [Couchioplanes azureus]|uniref:hypothetical protein n=1 Tax=Couchioplanes caeruleus TaxID=56438 RepID=UPI00167002A4|nr:hypothetical protein [Couchioplanes caeruleus]GGQ87352.1 hypothetical protein GCM10010166_66970 [Couchioplanes caeruleus subsp. azureus]
MFTRKIALLVAATVGITGCSVGRTQDAPVPPAEPKKAELHVSRAKDYTTMAQLKRDSTAILMGTAGASSVEETAGIQFTVTQFTVNKVMWGSVPSGTVAIRQLGGPAADSEDTSVLLSEGSRYVVFLKPFEMTPGVATGQYIVTGDRGLYQLDGKGRQYTFKGGSESSLPSSISTDSADTGQFLK